MVLDTCVAASLLYGCETWGDNVGANVETMYRCGIRSALSVRNSTNNEILYVETGHYPLFIRVKNLQMIFWKSIKNLSSDPDHHISKLINQAKNVTYMRYYDHLVEQYDNPKTY